MTERNGLRYALLGLALLALLGLLAWNIAGNGPQAESEPTPTQPVLESLAALDGRAPARRALDIQSWQTSAGSKVLFFRAPELPMFDLRLTFAAGSSQDGDSPGQAMLTNAMLNEGVPGMDVDAIAAGFEDLGAQFGNGVYRDMAIASLRSLSAPAQREAALDLFKQVIGQPTFPEPALQRISNQLLAGFEQQKKNPGKLASIELMQRLYGEHPYAQPSDGTAPSVAAINREQLLAFHRRAYAAGNVVIALVGDLSREEAGQIAEQVSAALPQGPALPRIAEPQVPKPGPSHIEYPSEQTHIQLAQLGIDRRNPDWPALYLGNQILGGGGFGSRLMEEVREKRGLTYGVYSGFSPMQVQGPFSITLQTRADLSAGTLELLQDILSDFLQQGPTQAELDKAKRESAGSFPLSTASNSAIVGQLGAIGFYDLPLTHLEDFMQQVQAVSREDVRQAMARHLSASDMLVVTAGPTVPQQPLPEPDPQRFKPSFGMPQH
jgi:zinc protease